MSSQGEARQSDRSRETDRAVADAPSAIDAVVFEPLFDDVELPTRATSGAAGYDLRGYLRGRTIRTSNGVEIIEHQVRAGEFDIERGTVALIPLGFRARLPNGYEAQIRIRSSVAFKRGLFLPNAPGTIDADYPDEWMVMVRNDSRVTVTLEHGQRIAQVVLSRFETLPWTTGRVTLTTDRTGGFGSTG